MPAFVSMTMDRARMPIGTLLAIMCAVLVGLGSGTIRAETGTPVPASGGVVREVLSTGHPAAAPGEVLELVRYTIPAGTQLPAHTHPGMQTAWIVSGTLHYTVLAGEVPVTRASGDETVTVTADSGEVAIRPGDAFVEAEGIVHFGRNIGPEPVVILVASLFTTGEPPAHVIAATPVATPRS